MAPGILTLTTDFGTQGPYVAALKGVVLSRAPGALLVDVTHSVSPQNILEGSYILAGIVDVFPRGTIHLAVIDPGVGTDRRLIAASMSGHWFVLPDNGLLSAVSLGREVDGVWELTNPDLRRTPVSNTFHGRDILAPAAAHLLLGGDPSELGPARTKFITIRNFEATELQAGFVGEVILRDSFGNLITNIKASRLGGVPAHEWTVEIAGTTIDGLSRTYGDQPVGTLVALTGSTGWIEIAVVNGDAARQLTAGPGTTVWIRKNSNGTA